MRLQMAPGPSDVQNLFDKLALRYDLFNRLISFGLDKSLRAKVLKDIPEGARVLDLGCGTGDLSLGVARLLRDSGELVGLDFSGQMLKVARRRYEALGRPMNGRFRLVQKSAEELPLDEKPFDLVLSGFVLRNLHERIDRVLTGIFGSLKEGGQARLLDFTEPKTALGRALFRAHMNTYGTFLGRLLFGKDFPAGYMAESARRFPKPEEFVERMRRAGFEGVRAERFLLGAVVLYTARKPCSKT